MKISAAQGGPSRRDIFRFGAASAVAVAVSGVAVPESAVASSSARPGPLRSAGALAFGLDNVLFVGDIKGAAVHAFALRRQDLTHQTGAVLGNFHNFEGRNLVTSLDLKIGALLGTTYDNIVINDMVVHQPSQQVFLSVERGRGRDALPAIVN